MTPAALSLTGPPHAIHREARRLVDPEAHTVEQLVLHGESYTIAASHGGDEVFRPTTFEGLEIPLGKLFAPNE